MKDVLQKGISTTVSAALVRRDGTTAHVQMTGRLVEYDGKKVIKTIITEKMGGPSYAVDAAAEDAHAIAVVEHAHDLMWSLDGALRLQTANAACRDFFFYVYGVRMRPGMAVMQFVPSDVQTVLARAYNEAIKHGSARVEQHFTHDGVSFDIEIVCSAVIDDNGTISGASFVARDVSERREREDEARSALKEKETLLQEAHHRVKNNLQVVASLLSIQLDRVRALRADGRAAIRLLAARRRAYSLGAQHPSRRLAALFDYLPQPQEKHPGLEAGRIYLTADAVPE